jgi:integrase
MPTTRLTSRYVRELADEILPQRDTDYSDIVLPRFGLRVKPPTAPGKPWSASYYVRYVADGVPRRHTIGDARTMDLDAARRAARAQLAIVDTGGDPVRNKATARAAWTVRRLSDAYLASSEFLRKTEKTRGTDRATITNQITHHLGREKLEAVDVPMVRRLIRKVETDSRLNARHRRLGGAGAARKAVRVLSAMLTWAVGEGQLARNPIIGNLRLDGDGMRETVITKPEDYARLLAVMDQLVGDGLLRPQSRSFIVTAAATGLRRSELQRLTWGQVDLAERRITLHESKGARLARSGPKTERVSLPPIAAAALQQIRPEAAESDEPVFRPQRGERIAINRDWNKIRDAAGLPKTLVLHSLRHSIGTAGILAGMSTAEVSRLLRHRNLAVTGRYVHLADQVRLQDRATAHLFPEPQAAAEPTRLPRRRA